MRKNAKTKNTKTTSHPLPAPGMQRELEKPKHTNNHSHKKYVKKLDAPPLPQHQALQVQTGFTPQANPLLSQPPLGHLQHFGQLRNQSAKAKKTCHHPNVANPPNGRTSTQTLKGVIAPQAPPPVQTLRLLETLERLKSLSLKI